MPAAHFGAVTSPMCAVSVRRLPNRDSGTCGALPVSISGISVSPAGAPEPEDSRREQPAPGGGEHEAGQRLGARKTKGRGGDANVSFLRPHGRIHDQDHSRQDEQGEHQGCGEPARPEPFSRASRTTGTSRKTAAKP